MTDTAITEDDRLFRTGALKCLLEFSMTRQEQHTYSHQKLNC